MAINSIWLSVRTTVLVAALANCASAAVPLAGFTPYVGLSLTDRFKTANGGDPNFILADVESAGPVGNWLSKSAGPHFEVAVYDSGASISLLTAESRSAFNLVDAGFAGENPQPISGAAGTANAIIEDPLSMFVAGLGHRMGNDPLQIDTSRLKGLSNVSIATGPDDLGLPNLVGLPLISQYATHFHSDQPLIFRHNGTTIRTPHVELRDRGSTERGDMLRADLQLLRSGTFVEPLAYFPDLNFEIDPDDPLNFEFNFADNPLTPTVVGVSQSAQAAIFIEADITGDAGQERDVAMMLDTGASVSVVSTRLADRLGFDAGVDEPAFVATVIGAGGAIEAPGFIAEELSIVVEGGEFTLRDVPLLAFNLPNIAELGSTLDGLLGMNVFSGRNIVLDPDPILSGGGVGPSLYISEPVTNSVTWNATQAVADWEVGANWSASQAPNDLAAVEFAALNASREAVLTSETQVYSLDIRGALGANARLSLQSDATLWVFGGTTVHENGAVSVAENAVLDTQFVDLDGGSLGGAGLVRAEIENRSGTFSPGDPVGLLTVEGIFANRTDAALQIDIGGTIAGEQHDVLHVDGLTVLGGMLDVRLTDSGNGQFRPGVGDTFQILTATEDISGQFSELTLPGGFEWDVAYNPTSVVLSVVDILELLGDFNGNGQVEQGDLDLVLLNWGADGTTPPTGWTSDLPSGNIDQDELDRVLLNWGNAAGSALVSIGGVPEPGAFALLFICLGSFIVCRRWRSGDFNRRRFP